MIDEKEIKKTLQLYGLGERMAERVAEELGYNKVIALIGENVYAIMRVDGISFQKADKIALNYFSYNVNDKRRQKALIYNMLESQKGLGHTYLPAIKLEKEMQKHGITDTSLLEESVKSGELVLDDNRVYTRKMFEAEVGCAALLKERFL
jgi:hypothetical protein